MPKAQDTWYRLDNAANLFPSVSGEKNTNVFRLTCVLKEAVLPDILQKALDIAMRDFAYYRVVMRRGLFWFYLERTDLQPIVEPETERPCSRIFYKNVKELLFRVNYFGRRVNLEVFHAVSDGTGALDLLRAIIYHYLVLRHRDALPASLPGIPGESAPSQREEDSFRRHYAHEQTDSLFRQKAYTIGGTLLESGNIMVIEALASTSEMLKLVKSKNATLTAYLAALTILSIYHELMPKRARDRIIAVTIPVDLRGHFSSRSGRNFFSVMNVGYNFAASQPDFDSVLASVCEQIKNGTQEYALASRINYTMGVQRNLATRFMPLIIKNAVLKAAYRKSEAAATCAISNLGRITMPDMLEPYIEQFRCLLNPTLKHRLKLTVCSYGDALALSFASCISETGAQTFFFRHLAGQGIDLTITSNGGHNDEVL